MATLPVDELAITRAYGPHLSRTVRSTTSDEPERLVKTHCCFCGQQCGIQLKRLQATHGPGSVAVLGGASLTTEKTYLLGKFARGLGGDDSVVWPGLGASAGCLLLNLGLLRYLRSE